MSIVLKYVSKCLWALRGYWSRCGLWIAVCQVRILVPLDTYTSNTHAIYPKARTTWLVGSCEHLHLVFFLRLTPLPPLLIFASPAFVQNPFILSLRTSSPQMCSTFPIPHVAHPCPFPRSISIEKDPVNLASGARGHPHPHFLS
jgi:hypothetical protein